MNLLSILEYIKNNKHSAFFCTPVRNGNAVSYFFKNPNSNIMIDNLENLKAGFKQIQQKINSNYKGFCLIPYETGYLFEERLQKYIDDKNKIPFFDFYFFENDNCIELKSKNLDFSVVENYVKQTKYGIDEFRLNTEKKEYMESIEKIKKYIEEGDTYQVNYTIKGKFIFNGDLINLFYDLIYNQSAEYTAIINLGDKIILSISPELFFEISGSEITVSPMKGTMKRGLTNNADKKIIESLKKDEKNKAENVMIVDLLRNDLGRICEYDSVKTVSLFDVHTYETLHQMTSTVTGKLKKKDILEILENIFPSGSITGAPKIRTMRIIHELEKEKRGYYTGTIGLILSGRMAFNIPIRTVVIDKNNFGEVGIGSGVVWDSNPGEEYAETLLKSNFLIRQNEYFNLFETMLFEEGKIFLYEYHLNRLRTAAKYFLFRYDEQFIETRIKESIINFEEKKKFRIKVILDKWGNVKIESAQADSVKKNIKINISSIRIQSDNKYVYHKTTNRSIYDKALSSVNKLGHDEVIFMNERDELTEGSITNIFILKNGKWYTPPVDSGLLNGCYRQYLLDNFPDHCEKKLYLPDLLECEAVKCVNSLRKEMNVNEIYLNKKLFRKF